MPSPVSPPAVGFFASWLQTSAVKRQRGRPVDRPSESGGLRFAFYGRISTVETRGIPDVIDAVTPPAAPSSTN
jgi:hypothetical protein